MFKRFLSYYKPHKKLFVLDMLASLSVALLGILYPIVTRTMLNDLIPNRQVIRLRRLVSNNFQQMHSLFLSR